MRVRLPRSSVGAVAGPRVRVPAAHMTRAASRSSFEVPAFPNTLFLRRVHDQSLWPSARRGVGLERAVFEANRHRGTGPSRSSNGVQWVTPDLPMGAPVREWESRIPLHARSTNRLVWVPERRG